MRIIRGRYVNGWVMCH